MSIIKFKPLFFVISALVLIPGFISLLFNGLRPAIDFTGGTLLELTIETQEEISITKESLQNVVGESMEISSVQSSGENQIILRGKSITNDEKNQVITQLSEHFQTVEEVRFETVGPTLGKELLIKTIVAVIVASAFILVYIAYRFHELKYGVCAILAMFHDSFILLGSFSLLGYFYGVEVDVLFVTALLTTLSFSVHDTIVVYDRIRELLADHPKATFKEIANAAIIETLGRSINNSVTIIIMLFVLALLGGQTIQWFAVALLIGAITGTYSSTFTAVPLLVVWEEVKGRIGRRS